MSETKLTAIKDTELYKKFQKALCIGAEMRIEPNPYILECCNIVDQQTAELREELATHNRLLNEAISDYSTLKSVADSMAEHLKYSNEALKVLSKDVIKNEKVKYHLGFGIENNEQILESYNQLNK